MLSLFVWMVALSHVTSQLDCDVPEHRRGSGCVDLSQCVNVQDRRNIEFAQRGSITCNPVIMIPDGLTTARPLPTLIRDSHDPTSLEFRYPQGARNYFRALAHGRQTKLRLQIAAYQAGRLVPALDDLKPIISTGRTLKAWAKAELFPLTVDSDDKWKEWVSYFNFFFEYNRFYSTIDSPKGREIVARYWSFKTRHVFNMSYALFDTIEAFTREKTFRIGEVTYPEVNPLNQLRAGQFNTVLAAEHFADISAQPAFITCLHDQNSIRLKHTVVESLNNVTCRCDAGTLATQGLSFQCRKPTNPTDDIQSLYAATHGLDIINLRLPFQPTTPPTQLGTPIDVMCTSDLKASLQNFDVQSELTIGEIQASLLRTGTAPTTAGSFASPLARGHAILSFPIPDCLCTVPATATNAYRSLPPSAICGGRGRCARRGSESLCECDGGYRVPTELEIANALLDVQSDQDAGRAPLTSAVYLSEAGKTCAISRCAINHVITRDVNQVTVFNPPLPLDVCKSSGVCARVGTSDVYRCQCQFGSYPPFCSRATQSVCSAIFKQLVPGRRLSA